MPVIAVGIRKVATNIIFYMIVATSLSACSSPQQSSRDADSALRGLSVDPTAKNIALIFGASNGLPGIDKDIKLMKTILEDPKAGYNFQVVEDPDASPSTILAKTKEFAAIVGTNGTLFWYFSGHGGGGSLMAKGGILSVKKVVATIKASRTAPLKRLMVFIDTCNNGNLTQTVPQMGEDNYSSKETAEAKTHEEQAAEMADEFVSSAYSTAGDSVAKASTFEQVLVMTSSTESETSQATGSGSAFTVSLANAFKETRDSAGKIKDLVDLTKSKTAREFGHHPQSRAVPESLLSEDLLTVAVPQQPVVSSIFVALSANDAAGNPVVAVSAPKNAAKIYLCLDTAQVCGSTPRADMTFNATPAPQGGDRAIFTSPTALKIESGKTFTLMVYDAADKPLALRAVRLISGN